MVDGRKGAPSKGAAAKRHPLTIPMDLGLLDKLRAYAATVGQSKTAAARVLIDEGIDEMRRRRVET